ncbi:MAG TPA: outer membrane beta-barrel protein [Anaeromyxobacter sp.]|nr:outer membrane beta-barrel protein [Anaeromyxobacter sp.]
MRTLRLLAAAAIAAAASLAHAQAPVERPYYVNARLGAYMPQDEDLDDAGFGAGFAGEVAIGRRFTPMFAAELGVGHFRSSSDAITFFDPDVGGDVSVDFDLAVTPIVATAKLLLPAGALEPYALAGAGVYLAEMTGNATVGGMSASVSDKDNVFGFHLGAGAQIHVTPAASLGLELRYVIANVEFSDFSDQSLGLDGLQISGGATFRF